MNVFLSHKMSGLSEEEIMIVRHTALRHLVERYGTDVIIVDNYHHHGAPENAGRLWHLGTSIKMLDEVDAIYFCDGWYRAKGCWVEKFISVIYKIKTLQ